MTDPDALARRVADAVVGSGAEAEVREVARLTGGATREMWSVVLDAPIGPRRFVVRLGGPDTDLLLDPGREHDLLAAAVEVGVPAPRPVARLDGGFVMEHVAGESIPARILRQDRFATARSRLPVGLGRAAAAVQAVPDEVAARLPGPGPDDDVGTWTLDLLEELFRDVARGPYPVLELALRWLRGVLPPLAGSDAAVVHGDLRMGNVLVDEDGLAAVLDWDLAHRGHPLEDLAWMCVRSWRFGNDDLPVAGVGPRDALVTAFEQASGRSVDRRELRLWEAVGNLRWGVITLLQARPFLDGETRAVEPATIGRRVAEAEWELLELMERCP